MALDFRPFLNTVLESVSAYTKEKQAYNNIMQQRAERNANRGGGEGEDKGGDEDKDKGGGKAGGKAGGGVDVVQASIRFNNAVHACDAQNLEKTLHKHGIYFDQSFNTIRNKPDVDHSIGVNCMPQYNVRRKGQDALHTLIMQCSDECNDVIQHLTLA
tara:strand:- start:22 stop:495 length:474 start_codon:yes stop_codon:yes gene_type:complete